MKAVILCGGMGTRLREETQFRPKPMVEVGGRPILWHIMKVLGHHGIREFVVCIGYMGNSIREYFLNYEAFNNDFTIGLGGESVRFHDRHLESHWTVTVVDTGLETNTGGRVWRAREHLRDGDFLVTYGDGLADVDIGSLASFHRDHGRIATLTAVRPPLRFGILELEADDRVRQFREKPLSEDWVNGGFMIFSPKVFDYLDEGSVLEREPLEALAKEGELMAYRHHGFFQPMDTYRETSLLNELWRTGNPPWKVWR